MKSLPTITNNQITEETMKKYLAFSRDLEAAKEAEKKFKADLLAYMVQNNIHKIDLPNGIISVKDAYDRESFDSKSFRADNPEVYDSYVKITRIEPSLLIKAK